ncbi:MAG: hypothetical protein PHE83_16780 [Opitutaceae bacterium]|nr:hypothetical protein [Opitutaceae bacterium]
MRDITSENTGLFLSSVERLSRHPEWELEFRSSRDDQDLQIEILPAPDDSGMHRVILTRDGIRQVDEMAAGAGLKDRIEALLMSSQPHVSHPAAAEERPGVGQVILNLFNSQPVSPCK